MKNCFNILLIASILYASCESTYEGRSVYVRTYSYYSRNILTMTIAQKVDVRDTMYVGKGSPDVIFNRKWIKYADTNGNWRLAQDPHYIYYVLAKKGQSHLSIAPGFVGVALYLSADKAMLYNPVDTTEIWTRIN